MVTLADLRGTTFNATTNEAGNFFVKPAEYSPVYPLSAGVTYQGVFVAMTTHVGGTGSCATCHVDPLGQSSPGHIYVPPTGIGP
jgi:hypothetical protein